MGKKAKKYAGDTRGFCTTSVAKKEEPKPVEEVKKNEVVVPTPVEQPAVPSEPADEEAEWEKAMAMREAAELSKLEANVAAPRANKELYPCGTFVASSELEKLFEECVAMEELSFPKMFKLKAKLTFERLKSIYAEIECHGFKHAQIAKAMETTLGYDHRAALEYLLITEPKNALPRTFQTDYGPAVALKELTQEEKDEQERERLLQDEIKLQELEAKREAMRRAAKEAADIEKKRKEEEANKLDWIHQYMQQSDSDTETDADPEEIIDRERRADPTARLIKIEVLSRGLEKRARDLKLKKKQGAFKMNMEREQLEQRELTSQLADYKNEIRALRARKYGKIAPNVDDMIQDALAAEKEAKAAGSKRHEEIQENDVRDDKAAHPGQEDGSEEDDVVDVFALDCTTQGVPAETGPRGTLPPHSLQIPKGWTGSLPMKYFEDWVKKTYGKQATVSRNATREGTGWLGTLLVRTPMEFRFTATYLADSKGDAFHMVSTTALYEMELLNPSNSKVEKNLPGPYRALYELWAKEALDARLEEQRATIRPRLELLDRLLRTQTQRDSAAAQLQNEGKGDNEDDVASDSGAEDIVHMRPPSGGIVCEWPPRSGRPLEDARRDLPAYDFRAAIIRTIAANKVCIVSGATGSGKTTQCPQYVLEDALERRAQDKEGTLPMIIVTEPRRISAISVATRVAEEMGVKVGTLVGYQVRMEKKWDPKRTRLLFCTTGVLIRKLRHDPKLVGVTHVFLDEVHERSAESDLTMLLLRRSLGQNNVKIIAMSATLDSRTLTSYFVPQTPHVEIPGRLYHVEELFVEDIVEATQYDMPDDSQYAKRSWWGDRIGANKSVVTTKGLGGKETTHVSYWDDDDAYVVDKYDVCDPEKYSTRTMQTLSKMEHTRINYELIDLVCEYIHEAFTDIEPHQGAVLIFLPGLMEISKSHASLSAHPIFGDTTKTRLISLHSVLSSSDQRQAFEVPPPGIRKIVLATNIAETGVTIPDVVFVIDCGKVKQQRYHEASNTASLKEMFVSQAEATQRRGRAGRIRSGFCFRLYTRSRFESFPRFPVPELLRCSLADLMLSVLCANQQPSLFEEALDPPPKARVDQAVQLLRGVGAAEDDGGRTRVTSLGMAVAKLPVDVRLGKMLLLHHLFLSGHAATNSEQRLKVLEGVPIAAAILSHRSPFLQPFQDEKRAQAKKVQEVFLRRGITNGGTSDHLAAVEAFFAFEKTPRKERETWCKKNWLNSGVLYQLGDVKDDLARHLGAFPAGPVVSSVPSYGHFVTACISAGLWPNVVRCDKGSGDTKSAISQGAESIKIHASSLINPAVEGPRWISYYQKVRTRATYLRDVTLMEPAWLLLFGSLDWDLCMQEKCIAFRNRDWQCIRVAPRIAALLRQIRQRFDLLLRSWLVKSRTKPQWSDSERSVLRSYMKAMTQSI